MPLQFVAYIRVSTSKQGRSGLGIEAQRSAIARFADQEGATIVAEHVEVETGKGGRCSGVTAETEAGARRSPTWPLRSPGRQARPPQPRCSLYQRPHGSARAIHRR